MTTVQAPATCIPDLNVSFDVNRDWPCKRAAFIAMLHNDVANIQVTEQRLALTCIPRVRENLTRWIAEAEARFTRHLGYLDAKVCTCWDSGLYGPRPITVPAVTRQCRHCDTTLHLEPSAPMDQFVWVDADNGRFGDDTDIPADPELHLHALGTRMRDSNYADMDAAREYSALKVRLEMGGTFHEHYPPIGAEPIPWGVPVPEHCGWPMWLRPSGWHCRQCKSVQTHGGVRR